MILPLSATTKWWWKDAGRDMSQSDIHDPTDRIPGTSWAKEMDILDSILEEEPGDAACIVEVMSCTEVCIKASFRSISNITQRGLHSKFILPKVSTTVALCLDKVYADSCSKSTKWADRALACLQALTLDAVGPISEAPKMIKTKVDKVKVDLDKLGAILEAAMTFLGNTSTQTANLRRQRIMQDINKDLVPYTMEQEAHFTA